MATNVHHVVRNYTSWARDNPTYYRRRKIQLFLASELLEFLAMDIVEPFLKTVQGNQNILVIMDPYFKLARAVLKSKMTIMHVTNLYRDQWIIPHGIPSYLLTDDETLLVSRLFAAVWALLGARHLTTFVDHKQTNGHAKRFKETILPASDHT